MLYEDAGVTVDRNFARFGSKSYAIDKINSVDVRENRPHGLAPVLIFGFLALMFVTSGIGAMPVDGGASFFVIAFACAGIAWWAWKRRSVVEYRLFLMTSSSEAQALETRDGNAVAELREAIETAMAGSRQHDMSLRFVAPDRAPDYADEPIDLKPAGASVRQRLLRGSAA